MSPIYFVSGNKEKVTAARHICAKAEIPLEQITLDIDEIQGEDPLLIVKAKAYAAYEAFGKPIVVSDDSWNIPALNGFPGAYMKSMNYWFTPEDFIRLTKDLPDRAVILHQYLAYYDGVETVIFDKDISGTILEASYGDDTKVPWMNVVTLYGDDGKSLAEVFGGTDEEIAKRNEKHNDAWQDLVEWYKGKNS